MSRWLPAVALGCLLAVLAIGAVVAFRPAEPQTTAERTDALARQLRCPDCQALSVADSPTQSAREIRRQIEELIAGGATDEEVRAHFVARYGEWILLAPSSPAFWVLPFAVVLVAAGGLAAWLLRRPRAALSTPDGPEPDERRRLHDEAEALDA